MGPETEIARTLPYPELGPCLDGVTETCCDGGSTEDSEPRVSILLAPPDISVSWLAATSDSSALSPSFACNQEMAPGEPGALSAEPHTLPEAQGEAEEGN